LFDFYYTTKKYKKIYIPHYLCGSIGELLDDYQIAHEFYHIDSTFLPIFDKKLNDEECLLIVNYLGRFTSDELIYYKNKFNNIFVDNTQSFFRVPVNGIDVAYSCRKYFGVPDGAYLHSEISESDYSKLEFDISSHKMLHIIGRYETSAGEYYEFFQKNELLKRGQPVKKMSLLVQNILRGIDYKQVHKTRLDNFNYIKNNINIDNEIEPKNDAGLFFYPLLIKNGFEIKRRLIANRIYVPTLWPNVLNNVPKNTIEYYFAANMIFLPIDQRYNIDDMEYMISVIKSVF
jgi:hypothetical protein